MLVKDYMTKDPITTTPETSVREAWRRMKDRRIGHLPVVERGNLVGITTEADLGLVMPSPASLLEAHEMIDLLTKVPVAEAMTRDPITIAPTAALEDAARLLMRGRIGALPVLEGGTLVGILAREDLLRAFLAVTEGVAGALAA
jgi:acetoin utilization protein AcuB